MMEVIKIYIDPNSHNSLKELNSLKRKHKKRIKEEGFEFVNYGYGRGQEWCLYINKKENKKILLEW